MGRLRFRALMVRSCRLSIMQKKRGTKTFSSFFFSGALSGYLVGDSLLVSAATNVISLVFSAFMLEMVLLISAKVGCSSSMVLYEISQFGELGKGKFLVVHSGAWRRGRFT